MATVAGETGAGLFLMHTRGHPNDMQKDTRYDDLMGDIVEYLREGVQRATTSGVTLNKIAVDPGIGFGKDISANLEILRRLPELRSLGLPVLLGTSRKSFIGKLLNQPDPCRRLSGTLATVVLGVEKGVDIFRVHDVRPAREAAMTAWAVRCQTSSPQN
jgi:dihydropteroate synthase